MVELDDKYIFLIKLKNKKFRYKEFDYIFKSNLYNKLKKIKEYLFLIQINLHQKLLTLQILLLAWLLPLQHFEALSANKPAIFFDPKKVAKNNYLEKNRKPLLYRLENSKIIY